MGLILCPFQAKFWLEMVLILAYIAPSWGSFYAPFQSIKTVIFLTVEMVLHARNLGYIAPSWGSFYAPVEHKNGHFFDHFMLYTRTNLEYKASHRCPFYAPVEHKNDHLFDHFMLYTRIIR